MPKLLTLNYTAYFTPERSGGYSVVIPALPGCNTQGDTYEEALENARDAIQLYLKDLRTHGEPIPQEHESVLQRIAVDARGL